MRNTSFALAVVVGTLGLWFPTSSSAQTFKLSTTLRNPSSQDDEFGFSVAVSGNNLLVGAPFNDNQGAFDSGAAYLFDAATGNLLQTLLNPSPDLDDLDTFGLSVAVSGDNLLVSAPIDTNQGTRFSGAAYLFDAATGDLRQTLLNPSPEEFDGFGRSVAVSGNYLLVGARSDNNQGKFDSGAAYLFDAATGNLLQTLLNPSPDNVDLFGASVAVSEDYLLIGAPRDNNQGMSNNGAAYLFDAATGDLLQTRLNPSLDDGDFFGESVAVSGNQLLVGAPLDDNQGASLTGAAYLFDALTGNLRQTLLNPSPDSFDEFGTSVSISENNVLVGAPFDNNQEEFSRGAAYLFDALTGNLRQTLLNPSPDNNLFGESVAVSGNNLLVGTRGEAYLFQPDSPPTTVPEPGSVLGLLALGTLGATALRQRRQS